MQETMVIVASVVALILGCVATVAASLHLPWPQRVHWLIASNALGYWGTPTEPIQMREVFVVDVHRNDSRLEVVVRTRDAALPDTELALTGECVLTATAHAARWRAAGTPLLLVSDGTGVQSLHGPTDTVCGFGSPDTVAVARPATSWTTTLRSH